MNLAFMNIGTQEMVVIILVALLLFGGKKLPELARGLGKGIREFKDASEGIKREISDQINNFEKEVEVVKSDLNTDTETQQAQVSGAETNTESPNYASTEEKVEYHENGEIKEKKAPQFSAPSGTYEHKPYSTPSQDDYYNYGYKDHFASNDAPADQGAISAEHPEGSVEAIEQVAKEEQNTKNS